MVVSAALTCVTTAWGPLPLSYSALPDSSASIPCSAGSLRVHLWKSCPPRHQSLVQYLLLGSSLLVPCVVLAISFLLPPSVSVPCPSLVILFLVSSPISPVPPPQLSLQVSLCLLFGRLSGMKSLPQLGTSGRGLVGCAVPGQG